MTTFSRTMDPGDTLDWVVDWSKWLKSNDTISNSSISVTGELALNSQTNDNTTQTAWVSVTGSDGDEGVIKYDMTSAGGRTKIVRIAIQVKDG